MAHEQPQKGLSTASYVLRLTASQHTIPHCRAHWHQSPQSCKQPRAVRACWKTLQNWSGTVEAWSWMLPVFALAKQYSAAWRGAVTCEYWHVCSNNTWELQQHNKLLGTTALSFLLRARAWVNTLLLPIHKKAQNLGPYFIDLLQQTTKQFLVQLKSPGQPVLPCL